MALKGSLMLMLCWAALPAQAVRTKMNEALQAVQAVRDNDPEHTALLVIDVQECFLNHTGKNGTGGAGNLAVPNSFAIIDKIKELRNRGDNCLWNHVVYSQDFHPEKHISFASVHGGKVKDNTVLLKCIDPKQEQITNEDEASCCPEYILKNEGTDEQKKRFEETKACATCQTDPSKCKEETQLVWPDHCVRDAEESSPASSAVSPALTGSGKLEQYTVLKGTNKDVDAYSAFGDNTGSIQTSLDAYLKTKDIKKVVIVGIAEDVCVEFTALDAVRLGYEVQVVGDASAALPDSSPTGGKAGSEKRMMEVGDKYEEEGKPRLTVVATADKLLSDGNCQ